MHSERTWKYVDEGMTCKILQHYGNVSTNPRTGWHTEFNLVSWGDTQPCYDLRSWAADHTIRGKGITLSKVELVRLRRLINTALQTKLDSFQKSEGKGKENPK